MIKPVAWMKVENYTDDSGLWEQSISFNTDGDGVPLYAIPDTHCIMPVRLTDKMIEAALPALMREDEDKYRALGQLICVWDALVEAAKEEGK